VKRTIPCLALVFSLFAFLQIAQGQTSVAEPKNLDKTSNAESLPELVRRVKPSVVSVLTYDAKGEPLISGTGFFIRPGEVVTNMHVIKNSHRVEIHTLEGKGRTYPVAGALAVDDEADLALLRVELPGDRSKPLSLTTSAPDEGEPVFLIGNPLRLEGSVSDGNPRSARPGPDHSDHRAGFARQ
jgi:S1-C subfamily serine protease